MSRAASTTRESRRREDLQLRCVLARLAAGERAALLELHDLLARRLSIFLLTLGLPPERVADVLAEGLFDVGRRPRDIDASHRALCGIAAVTYRHGIRALRRMPSPGVRRPVDADAALHSLPLGQRVVLGLIHGIGCSGDEVAHILQCPLASVVARMQQLRRTLRTAPRNTRPCAGGP